MYLYFVIQSAFKKNKMETLIFFGYLLLGLIVVLVIPIGINVWIYKKLRKTRYRKYAFLVPVLCSLFVGYHVYFALFPKDDFYKEDFESLSNMKFPKTGTILFKDADYPDIHGHYTSIAIVELPSVDFNKMQQEIEANKSFQHCKILYNTDTYTDKGFDCGKIKMQYYQGKLLLSFYNDNKTVFIQRGISDFSYIAY